MIGTAGLMGQGRRQLCDCSALELDWTVDRPDVLALSSEIVQLKCAMQKSPQRTQRKGGKESNVLIENTVMLIRGIIRTIKCHIESSTQEPLSYESLCLPWLVEHAGCILSRCHKTS